MSKLKDNQIIPGRIAFLSDDILRGSGACETDTPIAESKDYSVRGDHSFLIVKVDANSVVATPLLSGTSQSLKHLPLSNEFKSNFPRISGEKISYFYCEQFWRIPINVLKEASVVDKSPNSYRRGYAINAPDEIARILSMFEMDGAPIRSLRAVGLTVDPVSE